ncbi:MAG TPA: CxxxxCH/CxxCH domain-containing protein [Bacteroidota bacterium]|nr:CxxxxCH/CxxCH domain-containing protein [Bacteroidota bacterium]
MKTSVYRGIVLVVSIGLLAGCSKLKNSETPTAPVLSVHPEGFTDTASMNFHGNTVKQLNWNMTECKGCHGANYSGGSAQFSCTTCHVQPNGPEACNTCHGTFNAPESNMALWAPPRGVNGDTSSTSRGVGAHQAHLQATLGKTVKCQECHTVPSHVYAAGHFDSPLPAKVALNDTLANVVSGGGTFTPHPAYDATQLQCSNTFCHGNWQVLKSNASPDHQYIYTDSMMAGLNHSPKWTGGAAEAACGTCHDLPPKGHVGYPNQLPLSSCGNSSCHEGVVDASGKILNPALHINGKVDIEGTQRSF